MQRIRPLRRTRVQFVISNSTEFIGPQLPGRCVIRCCVVWIYVCTDFEAGVQFTTVASSYANQLASQLASQLKVAPNWGVRHQSTVTKASRIAQPCLSKIVQQGADEGGSAQLTPSRLHTKMCPLPKGGWPQSKKEANPENIHVYFTIQLSHSVWLNHGRICNKR